MPVLYYRGLPRTAENHIVVTRLSGNVCNLTDLALVGESGKILRQPILHARLRLHIELLTVSEFGKDRLQVTIRLRSIEGLGSAERFDKLLLVLERRLPPLTKLLHQAVRLRRV